MARGPGPDSQSPHPNYPSTLEHGVGRLAGVSGARSGRGQGTMKVTVRSSFDSVGADQDRATWAPVPSRGGFRRPAGVMAAAMVPLLALAVALGLVGARPVAAATVPAGFSDALVAGVPSPTALA